MATTDLSPDILIAGGGPAGLIATLVLAQTGYTVHCVDPGPRDIPTSDTDLRSTAFLMPAVRQLAAANVWDRLAEHAADLTVMRIAEAVDGEIRQSIDFFPEVAGETRFGCNVPNTLLRATLLDAVETAPNASFAAETSVLRMSTRDNEALVRLSTGETLRPALVIAADGRGSRLRDAAGIGVKTTRYGQKATVFAVEHDTPHDGISTEIHQSGGPFTIVPLAGTDMTRSAVVWMDNGPATRTRSTMDDATFEDALNARSANTLGRLRLASRRAVWPIITQLANTLDGPRLALIGEAGHVVPPIGAQGLNMSIADISDLSERIRSAPTRDAIGSPELLGAFSRVRLPDLHIRAMGIDALNRASIAGGPVIELARRYGLEALAQVPTLRNAAIHAGLGTDRKRRA